MGAPDRIYLQWHGDADPADYPNGPDPSLDDVTWCADKIYEHDIEYVPANEVTRLRAELAECRRDAERYRWLRSESCPWPGVFSIEGADDYGWYAICEGDLDQAIDDALAAKEKVK